MQMAQSERKAPPQIQIIDNTDGFHYSLVAYDDAQDVATYQCDKCGDVLLVGRLTNATTEPEQETTPEEQSQEIPRKNSSH
jgi:hypothetical protein